ncbi:hypothetical protein MKW92_018706 [Papaver armeniacum]|nr:hypothetical protein MKW92_018706 [Papaver armeniacum]
MIFSPINFLGLNYSFLGYQTEGEKLHGVVPKNLIRKFDPCFPLATDISYTIRGEKEDILPRSQ